MINDVNPIRVIVKGLLLFLVLELAFVSTQPSVKSFNLYTILNLQRQRFPISTIGPTDSAMDVGSLDAMFAAHIVSGTISPNEFRVFVLGDSAVWGIGLTPEQTFPGQLDSLGLQCGNKAIHAYNLSYPRSSATKDIMILDKALQYKPDMIIWLITWYTLMPKTRVDHPLVLQNLEEFYYLANRYGFLPKDFQQPGFADQVIERERNAFREARFQLFSLVQLATGLDQIPGPPEVLSKQLSSDTTFEGLKPPTLNRTQVSLDQVNDLIDLAGKVPVLLINEPILVVSGVPNSDIRYNDYYPRWVYDQYRQYLSDAAKKENWNYLDPWNHFAPSLFTDTPLHLNPQGEKELAKFLAPAVEKVCP